ncbi:hypothetical protein NP493_969g00021 [Ridgeia piscesae]|uniref:SH3 domain-containing protein n=1 Tax=Ridgeia piscesae TaxID=27915 RepID=A0AAD9KKK5_RIDPI|nr:hypothetical protein NP493_969g00021 [Ridgeia piscesae]
MIMEALVTGWNKYYCSYQKENKIFTMIPYNQVTSKGVLLSSSLFLSVARPMAPMTLQAISEEDLRLWLNAMDGKEPIYSNTPNSHEFDSLLDDVGFNFIKKCVAAIEKRSLEEQGLYRVVGVSSKINKLTSMGLGKTLPEPLMTFKLHHKFIAASSLNNSFFDPSHTHRVAEQSSKNLMTVVNIAVCFGPTLMRSREETMAAIMNIKFCNIVVEILIDNYEKIFKTAPEGADITNSRVLGGATASPRPLSHVYPRMPGGDAPARPLYPTDHNSYSTEGSSTESLGSKGSVTNSHAVATATLSTDSSRSPTQRHNNSVTERLGHCRSEPSMTPQSPTPMLSVRTARTLYSCEAENESELSFEPNQIIQNARLSREPGWLEGVLDGRVGLVPSNYVEFLD